MKKDLRVFWTTVSIIFTVALIICTVFGWDNPILLLTLFACGFAADWIYFKLDCKFS